MRVVDCPVDRLVVATECMLASAYISITVSPYRNTAVIPPVTASSSFSVKDRVSWLFVVFIGFLAVADRTGHRPVGPSLDDRARTAPSLERAHHVIVRARRYLDPRVSVLENRFHHPSSDSVKFVGSQRPYFLVIRVHGFLAVADLKDTNVRITS